MLTVSFLSLLVANTAASANLALQGFYWTLCGICKAQQIKKNTCLRETSGFSLRTWVLRNACFFNDLNSLVFRWDKNLWTWSNLKYIFVFERTILYLLISLQWKRLKICSDSQEEVTAIFQDAKLFIVLIKLIIKNWI